MCFHHLTFNQEYIAYKMYHFLVSLTCNTLPSNTNNLSQWSHLIFLRAILYLVFINGNCNTCSRGRKHQFLRWKETTIKVKALLNWLKERTCYATANLSVTFQAAKWKQKNELFYKISLTKMTDYFSRNAFFFNKRQITDKVSIIKQPTLRDIKAFTITINIKGWFLMNAFKAFVFQTKLLSNLANATVFV